MAFYPLCRPRRKMNGSCSSVLRRWPAPALASWPPARSCRSPDLKRDKGWVGMLLELYLGAMAGSKPEQDFPELGIELKTIPVDAAGKPLETTLSASPRLPVTAASLGQQPRSPQVGARLVDTGRRRTADPAGRTPRRLAAAVEPSAAEEESLRRDWEELMDLIVLGHVERITARHGECCSCAPKPPTARRSPKPSANRGNLS